MAKTQHRTEPDHETTGWPSGIKYIIGNEGCERFNYYGMRSILTVHLVSLYAAGGFLNQAAESKATAMAHIFFAGVYAFPGAGGRSREDHGEYQRQDRLGPRREHVHLVSFGPGGQRPRTLRCWPL